MSATMEGNLETFMNYFEEFNVGHVDIPSRLHNVDKFYLADVLAMTGYMPSNDFGGMFQPSAVFTSKFDSFPTVGQFNEDNNASKPELHPVRVRSLLGKCYQYAGPSLDRTGFVDDIRTTGQPELGSRILPAAVSPTTPELLRECAAVLVGRCATLQPAGSFVSVQLPRPLQCPSDFGRGLNQWNGDGRCVDVVV